jgi:2-phosphoglycerate kinase
VIHLILVAPDEAAHRRYFALRDKQTGQRRDKEGYLAHFEEIRMIHDFIAERALSTQVPIIAMGNFGDTVEQGLEHVLSATLKQRQATPKTKQTITKQRAGKSATTKSAPKKRKP